MTSRFAARKDKNQPMIEQSLTAAGYKWWSLHRQGFGVPDLLVLSKSNIPVLMEIKQPGEHLTDAEQTFHAEYKAPLEVVYDEQQCLDCMAYYDTLRLEAAT